MKCIVLIKYIKILTHNCRTAEALVGRQRGHSQIVPNESSKSAVQPIRMQTSFPAHITKLYKKRNKCRLGKWQQKI